MRLGEGPQFDPKMAAHAIATFPVLTSDNSRDFRDIPGLTVESWPRKKYVT